MTCDDCREWIHDDDGRIKMTQSQTPLPMRRLNGPPPCHRCPKVPREIQKDQKIRNKWEHAADISGDVGSVYEFYRRCRAVNRFPEDELVEEFALMISDAEKLADESVRQMSETRLDFVLDRLTKGVRRG